jgi:hypothetical protein
VQAVQGWCWIAQGAIQELVRSFHQQRDSCRFIGMHEASSASIKR